MITQTSTDGIIRNCNIKVNLTTNTIDWSAGESESKIVPIKVKYNNVVLENNNITINVIGTDNNSGYPTGYGLSIFANNTTIKNNNINYICKEGLSGWVYPIYVVTSNNTITDNNIIVKGTNYTAGIYFDSTSFSNNTVSNNIINLTCGASGYGEGTTNENVGYGVCFTNRAYGGGSYTTTKGSVFNNKVINNTIYTNGYSSYAVEQFGGDNTLIANNTLILNGTTPMGIGVIGLNTTITGNHITVTGKDNATYPSVDYIRPRTTGVYLSRGINNTVTNNTINSQNNAGIIIDGGETNDIVRYNTVKSLNNTYAVTVTGDNHQVTDNSLVAKELSGDNSVLATGENNTIKDNTGKNIEYVNINVDSAIIGTVNTPIAVVVNVTTTDGSKVGEGFVRLTDNKGNIIAGATVVDGSATIYTTFTTARARNIQVDYVGTDTYAPQTATTMIIVNKASGKDMLFTLNPVTAKINDTISISATLTNINGTAINGGVVIFKVNGRTLRDNDGNIIYAKVVDGVAMIDNFIVPKGWAKSSITFTAKYGGNNEYSPIMTNATMNITKSVAKVEITSNTNVVAGKPATFSVKVTSDDKPVNGGTVIFKINGKTLRDTDGNIIQANVVDGVATINYTIPQNMAAKEYNFTCVFGNSLYERSDVNSTLTVVEENFI